MWNGLPPNVFVLHPVSLPQGHVNLYSLTANYRRQMDMGPRFGVYLLMGGGWYYRYASIDQNYSVPPNTVCQPIYTWYGYACTPGGYIYNETIAYKGASGAGLNAGTGLSIRLSDSNWRFYMEARYVYAWTPRVNTVLIPITFGIRLN
jgi:hypothetical protein